MFKYTKRDLARLKQAHPDLQKVFFRVEKITNVPLQVLEVKRSLEQQKIEVAEGSSTTLRSRHLTGHAVDVVPLINGKPSFAWPAYYPLAAIIKRAAKEVNVPIEWGGDWRKFKDGPHWQLPWKKYPSNVHATLGRPMTDMTDQTHNQRIATAGFGGTGALTTFPIDAAVQSLAAQQMEFSSGDVTRMIVAVVILAATIGLYWWLGRQNV